MRQLAGIFPAADYPHVIVGLGQPDDAAVVRLDGEHALIATTDFFTPVVDDPWTFGAIAAVNAMSDVYAMGGDVLFCLNIAGFPAAVGDERVAQIFAGGAVKVREAGAIITGGHTITSPEPFYGLSVTGLIHPDRIMRKGGAAPGDRLFLTKPLGTGVITTAAKLTGAGEHSLQRARRRTQHKPDLNPADLDAAVDSMLRLNRAAAQAGQAAGVRSATDITGFGLLGHAAEMAGPTHRSSGAGFVIEAAAVPALPGAATYVEAGYLTQGATVNPGTFGAQVHFAGMVTATQRTLLWEAETSGGLLLAVPAAQVDTFRTACADAGQDAWEIGGVTANAAYCLEVV